jgi:hypothetical protein
MNKNTTVLVVIAVILGAVYVYYFTDWFQKETIQIIPTIRPSGRVGNIPRSKGDPAVYPVSFAFSGKYQLTSVKVVASDDLRTNKYPVPLWELISDSQSIPTKSLIYGVAPRGMKPSIPRARPQPLMPEIEYMLLLEAGKIKAQTNFRTREIVSPEGP